MSDLYDLLKEGDRKLLYSRCTHLPFSYTFTPEFLIAEKTKDFLATETPIVRERALNVLKETASALDLDNCPRCGRDATDIRWTATVREASQPIPPVDVKLRCPDCGFRKQRSNLQSMQDMSELVLDWNGTPPDWPENRKGGRVHGKT